MGVAHDPCVERAVRVEACKYYRYYIALAPERWEKNSLPREQLPLALDNTKHLIVPHRTKGLEEVACNVCVGPA